MAIANAGFLSRLTTEVYRNLADFLDLLSLVNSSVNFILYCIMSSRYRDTFWRVSPLLSKCCVAVGQCSGGRGQVVCPARLHKRLFSQARASLTTWLTTNVWPPAGKSAATEATTDGGRHKASLLVPPTNAAFALAARLLHTSLPGYRLWLPDGGPMSGCGRRRS